MMKGKQFFQKPAATLWAILTVCLSGIFIINACRKADKIEAPATVTDTNNMKERFYKEHEATDPLVQAVAGYFQHLPDTQFAVNKIIEQIGYPRWDKALIVSATNSGDSIHISYIPFVRDSQQFVNSSLLVKTSGEDTVFKYLCDWEYAEYGYDSSTTGWNALNVFHLFTILDKNVFNTTKYRIKDENLLTQPAKNYIASLGLPFDSVEVVYTIQPPGSISGRGNTYSLVTICNLVDVCINEYGYYVLNKSAASLPAPCTITTWNVCTDTWVEDFPGDGGTSGSGGSGGGGSNGGTPSDCNEFRVGINSNRTANVNPCEPGWEPIPIEDAYNPNAGVALFQYFNVNAIDQSKIDIWKSNNIDTMGLDSCRRALLRKLMNVLPSNPLGALLSKLDNAVGLPTSIDKFTIHFITRPLSNYEALTEHTTYNEITNEFEADIVLDSAMSKNATELFVANTLLHEIVHAYMA